MNIALPVNVDFQTFYMTGLGLWQGQYVSLYPLPLVGFLALFALLPYEISAVAWHVAGLMIWVAVLKRWAPVWLPYTPLIILFTLGQIDLWFLGLYAVGSPVALVLLTLKPQLFVLALPRLLQFTRDDWRRFFIWLVVLYGPVTILRPGWIAEWLRFAVNAQDGRFAQNASASFWSQPWLFLLLIPLIVWAVRRNLNWRGLLLALNPGVLPYDYVMLAGASLWLIPLSWVLQFWYREVPITERWMWSLLGVAAVLLERPLPPEQSLAGLWRRGRAALERGRPRAAPP
jgi:hypothetical protein